VCRHEEIRCVERRYWKGKAAAKRPFRKWLKLEADAGKGEVCDASQ